MSEELQRTEQWLLDRCGKFTGSRFCDVLAKSKRDGKPLKAYSDLVWQVVVERMTGQADDGPFGHALQWGIDVEPYAREAYELETGAIVTQSGFITHKDFPFCGCSPDGLIGDDGGLEMKCPKSKRVHLERFISGVPEEYMPQIQGCLWVTGRQWWDFVSYDPRMPESHRLLIIRVERDEKTIDEIMAAVLEAENVAGKLMEQILKKVTSYERMVIHWQPRP